MAKVPIEVQNVVSIVYLDLKGRIQELKTSLGIKQIARYNNQLETEKKNYSTILPACWIEVLPITWTYAHWQRRRAPITFRLHRCIQAHKADFETQDWEYNQAIHEKVQGFEGNIFSAFVAVNETINHNYGVWIDNMVDYRTFVDDESLLRLRNIGTITDITLTVEE